MSGHGGSEVVRARVRKANAAIEMRKAGASWEEVAEVLGYPTGRLALVATEKALERELKTPETKEFMRAMIQQRYDEMLKSVYPKAVNSDDAEHMSAIRTVREISADVRRMWGLDAATEVSIRTPAQEELEAWVAARLKEQAPELEEADIFEVVEGHVIDGEQADAV